MIVPPYECQGLPKSDCFFLYMLECTSADRTIKTCFCAYLLHMHVRINILPMIKYSYVCLLKIIPTYELWLVWAIMPSYGLWLHHLELCNREMQHHRGSVKSYYSVNPFVPTVPTFTVRETASVGIMGAPRVPPLNPSETIVFWEDYRLWGI